MNEKKEKGILVSLKNVEKSAVLVRLFSYKKDLLSIIVDSKFIFDKASESHAIIINQETDIQKQNGEKVASEFLLIFKNEKKRNMFVKTYFKKVGAI